VHLQNIGTSHVVTSDNPVYGTGQLEDTWSEDLRRIKSVPEAMQYLRRERTSLLIRCTKNPDEYYTCQHKLTNICNWLIDNCNIDSLEGKLLETMCGFYETHSCDSFDKTLVNLLHKEKKSGAIKLLSSSVSSLSYEHAALLSSLSKKSFTKTEIQKSIVMYTVHCICAEFRDALLN
jgi:hypothetical protein